MLHIFNLCTSVKSFSPRQPFFASFSSFLPTTSSSSNNNNKKSRSVLYSFVRMVFFFFFLFIFCVHRIQCHAMAFGECLKHICILEHCFVGDLVCACMLKFGWLFCMKRWKSCALVFGFNLIFMVIQCFTCVTTLIFYRCSFSCPPFV